MWFLPLDGPPSLALEPGIWRAPPWYSDADLARLGELLVALTEPRCALVVLPNRALKAGSLAAIRPDQPAILVLERGSVDAERLEVLAARWRVVVPSEGRDRGSLIWLERDVKPVLLERLQRSFGSEEHPLAAMGVASLDLGLAASWCVDPLDLLAVVEETLAHRLEFAPEGVRARDWKASLHRAGGRRLGERLGGLEEEMLDETLAWILDDEPLSFHTRQVLSELGLLATGADLCTLAGALTERAGVTAMHEAHGFWNMSGDWHYSQVRLGDSASTQQPLISLESKYPKMHWIEDLSNLICISPLSDALIPELRKVLVDQFDTQRTICTLLKDLEATPWRNANLVDDDAARGLALIGPMTTDASLGDSRVWLLAGVAIRLLSSRNVLDLTGHLRAMESISASMPKSRRSKIQNAFLSSAGQLMDIWCCSRDARLQVLNQLRPILASGDRTNMRAMAAIVAARLIRKEGWSEEEEGVAIHAIAIPILEHFKGKNAELKRAAWTEMMNRLSRRIALDLRERELPELPDLRAPSSQIELNTRGLPWGHDVVTLSLSSTLDSDAGDYISSRTILERWVLPYWQTQHSGLMVALTQARIADRLIRSGEHYAAARLLRESVLPGLREHGVAMHLAIGHLLSARVHAALSEIDEALALLHDEVRPAFVLYGNDALVQNVDAMDAELRARRDADAEGA